MNRIALAALSSAPLLIADLALGQEVLFDLPGEAAGDRFSHAVAGLGDVDGDLVPDWVSGAPFGDANGSMSGSATVYSGATGNPIVQFLGDSPGDLFGYSVAGADLNGDGVGDIVIGAHGDDVGGTESGTVYVYSGVDNSLLFSRTGASAGDNFGFAVSCVPDTDGDGMNEVLVGAWTADAGASNSGRAYLLKGTDGSTLQTFDGEQDFDFFGKSLAGLSDVNADGFGDVLIGAPGNSAAGSGAGAAYVFSGADGVLLQTMRGDAAGDGFGSSLSPAGDLNNDGAGDYLIGAPGSDVAATNAGMARAVSGPNGATLFNFYGLAAGDNFGSAVCGGADVTTDGVLDLIVGAHAADPKGLSSGQVFIFAGSDGALVNTIDGSQSGSRLGAAIQLGGDANGDGVQDLLLGAWGEDVGADAFTGVLHVVTFGSAPIYVTNYCQANPNSQAQTALISASGSTSVATSTFALHVQGAVPSVPGLFFYGPNEVETPFGDGFLCVGGQVFRLPVTVTDSQGDALLALDLANQQGPNGIIQSGNTWKFQYWYRDPQGVVAQFNLSDGLSVDFID